MKLNTPFTILNRKFNEMDLIRHAMKSKEKSANKRLHDNYRKIFKSDNCIMYCDKEPQTISKWYDMFNSFDNYKLLRSNYFI